MSVRNKALVPSMVLLAGCSTAVAAPSARPRPLPAPADMVAEPLAQRPIDIDADHVPLSAREVEVYPAARDMPADVQRFIVKWSDCAHWLGEPPWDEARQRQIDEAVAGVCPGVDMMRAELLRRHAGNAAVAERLRTFEPLDQ